MAIKQEKVSDQEFDQINDFQKRVDIITLQLGQLSLRRLSLEKEEENIELQYEELLTQEKQLGDSLKEKYGEAQIDTKTGKIIYPE